MAEIENYIPITQAKARLLEIIRELNENDDTVAITRNGVPETVMVSMKKFQGLMETIEILADTSMMEQLRHSAKDIEQEKLLDIESVF